MFYVFKLGDSVDKASYQDAVKTALTGKVVCRKEDGFPVACLQLSEDEKKKESLEIANALMVDAAKQKESKENYLIVKVEHDDKGNDKIMAVYASLKNDVAFFHIMHKSEYLAEKNFALSTLCFTFGGVLTVEFGIQFIVALAVASPLGSIIGCGLLMLLGMGLAGVGIRNFIKLNAEDPKIQPGTLINAAEHTGYDDSAEWVLVPSRQPEGSGKELGSAIKKQIEEQRKLESGVVVEPAVSSNAQLQSSTMPQQQPSQTTQVQQGSVTSNTSNQHSSIFVQSDRPKRVWGPQAPNVDDLTEEQKLELTQLTGINPQPQP